VSFEETTDRLIDSKMDGVTARPQASRIHGCINVLAIGEPLLTPGNLGDKAPGHGGQSDGI
jgi:hypothetical protein